MGIFFPILSGVENGRFIRWKCLLFQFLCRRIGIHIPVRAGAQNGRMLILKKSYFTKKLFFLKLNFQVDSHLYAICLFFILILYRKCFFFSFCIVAYVCTNGSISSWENVIFFGKMLLLKLNFQDKDQLYANCLFHILSLYRKCFLFQLLIRCIRMHIHILTGDQTWRIISWKNGHFCRK